ncbi:MAG: ABC transporter substrate-binding protein [Pseudolabrys sp.]|nr:ABC transporter substrate-binding protein [Pseudolabrys sp.]
MHFSDYGVKALSMALAVHEDTIREKPDMVRRFVKATNRGWDESIKNPAEAAKIGKKHFPHAEEHLLKAKFEAVAPLMHTDATTGKATGWMAESDWDGTLAVLKELSGLKTDEPASAFYTNDFIPTN